MKTFIEFLKEERKNSDFIDTFGTLFNIDQDAFEKALEKTPSVFSQALYGDDQIGLGAFDTKKAGSKVWRSCLDPYADFPSGLRMTPAHA